jgi:anti-sigma regulatory factor (Ser/Thr protein kinase)
MDSSQVAEARRAATRRAQQLGFSASDAGRVALVATEAATNLLKHAGGGVIVIGAAVDFAGGCPAIELVAIDNGPGMADVEACLVDGRSTAGSPGTGLGAMRRVSSAFDVYSQPGAGTVLFSSIAAKSARQPPQRRFVAGGVSVAYPGEPACGDIWTARTTDTTATVVLSDGLGHGVLAAEAAGAVTEVFTLDPGRLPADLVTRMHDALLLTRQSRGAAVAVARIEPENECVRYCGIGNISGSIVGAGDVRHLVSHNGTIGRNARRIQEFTYDWPSDGLLVLHSDGIGTRWRLSDYPGLMTRHPSVIAGVLYRDVRRGRDDAAVAVVRYCSEGC